MLDPTLESNLENLFALFNEEVFLQKSFKNASHFLVEESLFWPKILWPFVIAT